MRTLPIMSIVAGVGLASSAFAQGGTSFGTAVTHQPGTVNGTLVAATVSETLFATLTRQERVVGGYNNHLFTGLTPGAPIRAAMRQSTNPGGGLDPTWDSYMRLRDSADTATLFTDDDDGPDALSAMLPTESISAPANGEVRVQITGYNDRNTYTGADSVNAGFYDLDLFQRTVTAPGVSVQWYRFENLGGLITGNVVNVAGISDSMLMLFDSSGTTIFANDDLVGLSAGVEAADNVLAPGDGIVYAAVTYYRAPTTTYLDTNSYTNNPASTVAATFTLTLVPAPGSIALLGLGGLMATRRRRA